MWQEFLQEGAFFGYLAAFVLIVSLLVFGGHGTVQERDAIKTVWANRPFQVLIAVAAFLAQWTMMAAASARLGPH